MPFLDSYVLIGIKLFTTSIKYQVCKDQQKKLVDVTNTIDYLFTSLSPSVPFSQT